MFKRQGEHFFVYELYPNYHGKAFLNYMGHSDIKVTLDTYADVFDNFQSVSVEKADSYLNQVGLAV